jgi:hypothetical protein
LFPHLQAILPDLKAHFKRAYICPPLSTHQNDEIRTWLAAEPFFTVFPLDRRTEAGEHFAYLYLKAARTANPDEILHLGYLDRLAFALEGSHRASYLAEVDALTLNDLPRLYHRSPAAWKTHPENYHRLEGFVTHLGELLFGKTLDYGWCYLVVRAGELAEIMPKVTHPGISMVAEMVLHLQHHLQTREVDWLAWEDPFLLGRDAAELKTEREQSAAEYEKRLAYCLPMVEALTKFALDGKK